ncbi:hypothetical protein [Hamadaea sp.]|uniref:hypothetical protein n=1 Tax=Hamadaea sp. TaxID=2024425 RepID=UPI0025BEE863|nr:hypothetical protein [Hamadaea sp.]
MLTSSIEHDWQEGVWLATLTGDYDRAGHADLRRLIRKCLADDPAAIVVDVTGVTPTADALMPVALATEQRWVARHGVLLVVVLPEDELARTPVGRRLTTSPTVAAARFVATRITPHRWLHLALEPHPETVNYARNQAGAACLNWDVPWLQDAARRITTELVANAIAHAGDGAELTVSLQSDLLRIRVHDHSVRMPVLRPTISIRDWEQQHAHGLQLGFSGLRQPPLRGACVRSRTARSSGRPSGRRRPSSPLCRPHGGRSPEKASTRIR